MILSRMRMMSVDEAEAGKDAADDEMGRAYGMRTARPRVLSARSRICRWKVAALLAWLRNLCPRPQQSPEMLNAWP
jgi:hypothetical protein